MSLKISYIHNTSNSQTEYVMLDVLEDCNLEGYAIVDRTFKSTGAPSNKFRHIYAFKDYKVLKNQHVQLCTGIGTDGPKQVGSSIIHFFYWNAKECVWNNTGDTAILINYKLLGWLDVPVKK